MKKILFFFVAFGLLAGFQSCSDDDGDNNENPDPVELNSKTYALGSVAVPEISGSATFIENEDGSVTIDLDIENTPAGGQHPAHIHFNTAAEGGGIALTLGVVDGDTGESSVTVTALDDGTPITYEGLLDFDGYINVHLSADDLATIVAQGDIGQNELTGETKTYDLGAVAVPDISGTATFSERVNGEALATIALENTPVGGSHPAHIHNNTAAEGGGIAFTFTPVNGDTGMSKTNVAALDDGTAIGYAAILGFDGYINVHLSADDLATIVAQGDIGQNELTGESKTYELGSVAVPDISGTATFSERVNGEALAVIALENTPEGGSHPAHIHNNTAAEGGGIAFTFTPVNGDTGMSKSNVAALDDGTAFGYAEVLTVDGYINVHLSADDLATIVAQGDIGQNELTGESITYELAETDVPGISGTALFEERVNETTLVTISLMGTPDGGSHPAHIHENDVATTGPIIVGLTPVNGDTGISKTQVEELVGGAPVTYTELLSINAYINVHLSDDDLATIVAQGNIGANAGGDSDSGSESVTYDVVNSGASAYIFNGGGLTDASNPDLTLKRGSTYTFNISAPGHPFLIKEVQGTSTANTYDEGVTNNGAISDSVTFTVPMDAPDTLFYNCEFHSSMTGTLTIVD